MYAAALQGNLTIANASAKAKKPAATAASSGKRKGASKAADDSHSTQETVPFVSREEMKTHIRSVNDELPDEILDLLTDNLYRYNHRFVSLFDSAKGHVSVRRVDTIWIYLFNA